MRHLTLTENGELPLALLLIPLILALAVLARKPVQKLLKAHADYLEAQRVEREKVVQERGELLGKKIAPDIQRDMEAFQKAGFWDDADPSPLTWAGYRVGRARGLTPGDRQRRLSACFRAELPAAAPRTWRTWGKAATYGRFAAIHDHLLKLANQRRSNPVLKQAVQEWDHDRSWFIENFSDQAERFKRHGFRE